MSEPYKPSNSMEGDWFQREFCGQCKEMSRYRATDGNEGFCHILGATMAYRVEDPEYPKEWIRKEDGAVTCTAFNPEK